MDELRQEVEHLKSLLPHYLANLAALSATVAQLTARVDALAAKPECHHIFSRGPFFNLSGTAYYQCELCGKKQVA